MSVFCKYYYVLKEADNESFYVFIDRKDYYGRRFVVWKTYNYRNSGYGYAYGYSKNADDAIKNGVFPSAEKALNAALDNYPEDGMVMFLHNLQTLGPGEWVTNGKILWDLCYDADEFK